MANRAAFIVNPTKLDHPQDARSLAERASRTAGWDAPLWLETTEHDVGTGQARQALDAGVQVVCAWGGDGTVRAVAAVLAGTTTPLGIIPGGTGNLLARNLDLPIGDPAEAIRVALTGVDRAIDVGRLSLDGGPEQVFLVIGGVGLDAQIMQDTDERAKKVLGWVAYGIGMTRAILRRGFRVSGAGLGRRGTSRAKSVMVCNCGLLTGGLEIAPEARPDDGLLDVVVLSPSSLFGWGPVVIDVLTRHRRGTPRVQRLTADRMEVQLNRPVIAQVDGDLLSEATRIQARVDPHALLVRVRS